MAALDAVRALAIVLVFAHHAAYRFDGSKNDLVAAFFRSTGWIGVDVFFALSGYLIVKILLRDSAAFDIGGFFRRRFFRIVPVFLVALAVFAGSALLTGHDADNLHRLWVPALFLNGWLIPYFGVDQVPYLVAWSLSIEEFAYLVLGASAFFSRKMLSVSVVGFLVVAVLVRWSVILSGVFDREYLYYFVPGRLDAIALGGLGALGMYSKILDWRYGVWAAGTLTMALMVSFQWTTINDIVLPAAGYLVFGLACGIWVTGLAGLGNKPVGWLVRWMAPVGQVSYFIYLFHLFVLEAVRRLPKVIPGLELSFWPGFLLSLVLCFIAAKISWRYFESPLIQYSQRKKLSNKVNSD